MKKLLIILTISYILPLIGMNQINLMQQMPIVHDQKLLEEVQKNDASIEEITELLNKDINVNTVDQLGMSALHFAVSNNRIDICELLLKRGASINQAISNNRTALFFAAREGKKEICKLLLDRGATINIVDIHGYNTLAWAASHNQAEACKTLITNSRFSLSPITDTTFNKHVAKLKAIWLICKRKNLPKNILNLILTCHSSLKKPLSYLLENHINKGKKIKSIIFKKALRDELIKAHLEQIKILARAALNHREITSKESHALLDRDTLELKFEESIKNAINRRLNTETNQ